MRATHTNPRAGAHLAALVYHHLDAQEEAAAADVAHAGRVPPKLAQPLEQKRTDIRRLGLIGKRRGEQFSYIRCFM